MNTQTKPKVVCIGWHKTGTSTMGDALLSLGYKVIGAREDLAYSLLEENIQPALTVADDFEALQDVPWAALFKELDQAFPNSKFILTTREEQAWLNSAKKHFKDGNFKLHEWLYGNGVLEGNEDLYLKRYRAHYEEVKAYFKDRPDDLIVMDFKQGDSWEKLCSFLNQPIPKKAFPHSNKGKHNYTLKDKFVHALRQLSPNWLRQLRIKLLLKLGFPDKRDRFNNKQYNKAERNKRKQVSK
ncbi:sulfotransferase family protein [Psychroflexus aestuariivivens]|uniref:sulfotransferase family protein n=1 Tax=Psychroflexus aestuariivivens TaxID=1795040 RepID=UPI000FD7C612|nr:sulfotransferase family protein [Psychroflexus aestuariivivens]